MAVGLVRLYPRAWRARYGAELAALLDAMPMSWRVRVDLLRGAAREWLHELSGPHVVTPGRRLAWRLVSRVLTSVAVAAAVVWLSRYAAARLTAAPVPTFLVVVTVALHLAMMVRAIAVLRSSVWLSRPGVRRRTVSYLEFAAWVAVAVVVATLNAIDAPAPMPAPLAILTWWLWIDWLLAATPRVSRHTEIERRLMRRPRLVAAANERYERRRAENAARLIEFYSRFTIGPAGSLDPIASIGGTAGADRVERT